MKKITTLLLLGALAGVPACSSDATGGGGGGTVTDGGSTLDGGDQSDAGGGPEVGATDSGKPGDTGATDAGTTDAGTTDTGTTDTGTTDTGPSDDGAVDAGATDTGPTDDGAVDAGTTDTGPADDGAVDAGTLDGGATDGGSPVDVTALDVPPVDAGVDVPLIDSGVDVPPVDTGVDVPPVDTGVDVPATDVPAGPYNPCLPSNLVNLSARGTVSGATTRYVGTNVGIDATNPFGAVTCGRPGHEVAFTYTTRSTTRLVVSTVNPGTPTTFDTVAFALAVCGPVSAGNPGLGCNDDSGDATRTRASTFTTTSTLPAGTTVVLVVAGYTPATGTPWTETGPFELSVTELPQVAVGGACDSTGAANFCAPGSTCIGTGAAAVCVADGTVGGACRTGAGTTPCDAPATCRTSTNRCIGGTSTYTESALATPTFIDACGADGRHVVLMGGAGAGTNRDDNHSMAAITLPFTFTFFGTAQTTIWPDTNGYAQFGSEPNDNTGGTGTFPSTGDGPVVAPFWDDLVLRAPVAPSTAENLCVRTVGTAPNRQFVIEWSDAYRYGHMATHLTFEAILNETTNTVDYVYNTLTGTGADAAYANGTNAALGAQNDAGALYVVHTGAVTTTAGIRLTPH